MNIEVNAIIYILIGLLFCFYGYRIQKLMIAIAWFAIGFQLMGMIGPNFINDEVILLVVKIIVGLILASIGFKLEKLAIFIAAAYLAYETLASYVPLLHQTKELTFLIQGGLSLLIGALAILFIKPILIIITGVAGANFVKECIPTFITLDASILTIGFIVLAVLGILFQFKNN